MTSAPGNSTTPGRQYNVISGDGHLEVPPEDWYPWVPAKFKDRAPRIVSNASGDECYAMEGIPLSPLGPEIQCGDDPTVQKKIGNSFYEADGVTRRFGLGDAVQRLHEMDYDGIDAEVLFPPLLVSALLRRIDEDEVYLSMIQAYNSWLAEAYCSVAPDRLIGVAMAPESNLTDAMEEMRRCRSLGLRAIAISSWPSGGGRYQPEDDAFFEALLEEDMRLTPHVSFGDAFPTVRQRLVRGLTSFKDIEGPKNPDRKFYPYSPSLQRPATSSNILEFIVNGVFDRLPELKVYFAESHAYWVPEWLVAAEETFETSRFWYDVELPRRISDYVRESVIFGFVRGHYDVHRSHWWGGENNIAWGSDCPHHSGTFPWSHQWIDRAFDGETESLRRQALTLTMADYFNLDPDAAITPTPPGGPYEHPNLVKQPLFYKDSEGNYVTLFNAEWGTAESRSDPRPAAKISS
jgi:uncharacterized protein